MEKEKITPEEKLLKIIENPDVEKHRLPLVVKVKSINATSLKNWFNNFHIEKSTFGKLINFGIINKIIAAACVFITIVWIFDFTRAGIKLSSRFKQVASGEHLSIGEEKKQPNIDINIEEAITQVKRRNMFTFLPTKEEIASTVSIGPTLSNFKLVGILWSDNPQAMIENSKEQKTYFVSKGDVIGEIEVRKILKDKVMVGKGSEEWELR